MTLVRLYSFLKTNAKVHIQAPGCVKELDDLSQSFVENSSKRKQILSDAEAFIENIDEEEVNKLKDSSISMLITKLFRAKSWLRPTLH